MRLELPKLGVSASARSSFQGCCRATVAVLVLLASAAGQDSSPASGDGNVTIAQSPAGRGRGRDTLAAVHTVDEFVGAIQSGKAHIVVEEHLSFARFHGNTSFTLNDPDYDHMSAPVLFRPLKSTGSCLTVGPKVPAQAPSVLQPQCVITVPSSFLLLDAHSKLLVSDLYIQISVPRDDNDSTNHNADIPMTVFVVMDCTLFLSSVSVVGEASNTEIYSRAGLLGPMQRVFASWKRAESEPPAALLLDTFANDGMESPMVVSGTAIPFSVQSQQSVLLSDDVTQQVYVVDLQAAEPVTSASNEMLTDNGFTVGTVAEFQAIVKEQALVSGMPELDALKIDVPQREAKIPTMLILLVVFGAIIVAGMSALAFWLVYTRRYTKKRKRASSVPEQAGQPPMWSSPMLKAVHMDASQRLLYSNHGASADMLHPSQLVSSPSQSSQSAQNKAAYAAFATHAAFLPAGLQVTVPVNLSDDRSTRLSFETSRHQSASASASHAPTSDNTLCSDQSSHVALIPVGNPLKHMSCVAQSGSPSHHSGDRHQRAMNSLMQASNAAQLGSPTNCVHAEKHQPSQSTLSPKPAPKSPSPFRTSSDGHPSGSHSPHLSSSHSPHPAGSLSHSHSPHSAPSTSPGLRAMPSKLPSMSSRRRSGPRPVSGSGRGQQFRQDKQAQLEEALDELAESQVPFLGRFAILGSMARRMGGQGIVQFAADINDGQEYAIKFYTYQGAFDREAFLYQCEDLRTMMSGIRDVVPNLDGAVRSPSGWVFPPCIILERGESLDEWALRVTPDFPTILTVLCHVTERLVMLHGAGIAHRDLKPGNVLWRPKTFSWTLIDFGCAAEIGSTERLAFSLLYTAPEIIQAMDIGQRLIVVDAAVDMWALGVMAFELLTGSRAFPRGTSLATVKSHILDGKPFPWETQDLGKKRIPTMRMLQRCIFTCLNRDPKQRPSSAELLKMLNNLFDATTGPTGPEQHLTGSAEDGQSSDSESDEEDNNGTIFQSQPTTVPSFPRSGRQRHSAEGD